MSLQRLIVSNPWHLLFYRAKCRQPVGHGQFIRLILKSLVSLLFQVAF